MKTSPKQRELRGLATLLGFPEHPVTFVPIIWGQKTPYTKAWQLVTPEEGAAEPYWKKLNRYGNTGLLLGEASGGLCAIDCDKDDDVKAWLKANPALHDTLQRVGKKGLVFIIRITDDIPRNRNFAGRGEWKAKGTQVVLRGGHPSGVDYRHNGKAPIPMSFRELTFPAGWEMKKSSRGTPQKKFFSILHP